MDESTREPQESVEEPTLPEAAAACIELLLQGIADAYAALLVAQEQLDGAARELEFWIREDPGMRRVVARLLTEAEPEEG